MKKQKSIDSLLASLEKQKGAVVMGKHAKSVQYWCGLSVIGGDSGNSGEPPRDPTGSQMTEQPDVGDHSDCPHPDDPIQ